MAISFGDFRVDFESFELLSGGEQIKLEPRVFDVLRYLILHRDRVVPREELLGALWQDDHVVDAVVTRCIYELRRVLGQSRGESTPIDTVHGRGYRFTATVVLGGEETSIAPSTEPFVGRGPELQRLRDLYTGAAGGTGVVCLLAGEPGVGKTRLVEELMAHVATAGGEVWVARCHEQVGAPPFWLWTQVIRACLRGQTEAALRAELGPSYGELAAVVPELGTADSYRAGSGTGEADVANYRLFDAVTRVLRMAIGSQPRLLLLEDVHWADLHSLLLLGYLVPEMLDRPLLIIASYRDSEWETHDPRRAALDGLSRNRGAQRIELGPLSAGDVDDYVARVLGQPRPELSAALHRTTEGNAFFMVEATRPYVGEAASQAHDEPPSIPEASRELVRRRVMRLQPAVKNILQAASVIGREFGVRMLTTLTGIESGELLQHIQPALSAHLLVAIDGGAGRFAFSHALVRESVYGDLPLADRARLHAAAAVELEGHKPPPLSELSHHFHRALPVVEPDRAAHWSRRAGEAASAVYAHGTAAFHYQQTVDALSQADDGGQRAEVLLLLGRAQYMAGLIEDARTSLEAALDMGRRAGNPQHVALSAIALRDCQPARAVPDAAVTRALQLALDDLPPEQRDLRARLLSRLAAVRAVDVRRAMSDRAAELARDCSDPVTQADVLRARLHAAQGPDAMDLRLQLAQQLVQLADEHDEPMWARDALMARYECFIRQGDMGGADGVLGECAEIAEHLRHPGMAFEVARHRTQRALCSGRYADAEAGILRDADTARRLASPFGRFYFLAQMLWLLRARGLLEGIGDEGERFIERHPWVEQTARATIGVLHLERGDMQRASQCFEFYAARDFGNVPFGEDFVMVFADLALLCVGLKASEHTQRIHDTLLPYAQHNVANGPLLYVGQCSHFVGLLAQALGQWEAAAEHFDSALQGNRRMGALPALLRTQRAYAALLSERDPGRAAELQQQAERTAAQLGLDAAPAGTSAGH